MSSWDTFAMKSVRSVSVPESSWAMRLKQAAISFSPLWLSRLGVGAMRTEKSPCMSRSAASRIRRTGLSIRWWRRTPSSSVSAPVSASTLTSVIRAACRMSACVSASSISRAMLERNSSMQQVTRNPASEKKIT